MFSLNSLYKTTNEKTASKTNLHNKWWHECGRINNFDKSLLFTAFHLKFPLNVLYCMANTLFEKLKKFLFDYNHSRVVYVLKAYKTRPWYSVYYIKLILCLKAERIIWFNRIRHARKNDRPTIDDRCRTRKKRTAPARFLEGVHYFDRRNSETSKFCQTASISNKIGLKDLLTPYFKVFVLPWATFALVVGTIPCQGSATFYWR